MFGKKKKQIAEQAERIKTLEQQIEALNAENQRMKDRMLDVERRERGIGRAINEATATADNMINDAQRKADVIMETMKTECDTQRKKADRVVEDAYRNAREIIKEAEDEGQRKQDEMQARIEQYAALLNGYDTMVQEQLEMAKDGARRFEELSRALHEAIPQLLGSDGAPLPGLTDAKQEPKKTPEPETNDEPLWTVDKITNDAPKSDLSDVDSIIDEILAAAENEA